MNDQVGEILIFIATQILKPMSELHGEDLVAELFNSNYELTKALE